VISDHSATTHALQICDIITYNDDINESNTYRVKSFLKQWVPPALTDEEQSIMDLLNIDNNNREDEALPARIALVRCHPEDAQFVSAIGTCGIIAPITHVTRVGCVDWDDDTINEERERYAKLDTEKAKNFLAYIDDRWEFLRK